MSRTMTALLDGLGDRARSIEQAARELAEDLARARELYEQEQTGGAELSDARLANLAEVTLPAYAGPKELDDVRAAYVLQSFLNLGRPPTQEEAAEIARRAGYTSGRAINIFYTHGWLHSDKDERGVVGNRRISPAGQKWLEEKGRVALLAWLGR